MKDNRTNTATRFNGRGFFENGYLMRLYLIHSVPVDIFVNRNMNNVGHAGYRDADIKKIRQHGDFKQKSCLFFHDFNTSVFCPSFFCSVIGNGFFLAPTLGAHAGGVDSGLGYGFDHGFGPV